MSGAAGKTNGGALLRVEGLRVAFEVPGGEALAVDGLDLELQPGEALALVGESGCGKTVTAQAILGLLQSPPARVTGRALLAGRDLLQLGAEELRRVRGREVGLVFQEAGSALNPVLTVGEQVADVLRAHEGLDRKRAHERAVEMLARVGLPDAEQRAADYPHQLSGGMRQRVLIAAAVACEPAVLIADEPTSALDVTVQAQILDLIDSLRERGGTSMLLITHDLAVVAQRCDRVAVLYAGRVVEEASTAELFARPTHPYTRGLLASLPELCEPGRPLPAIPGSVPEPRARPSGCPFHPRCGRAVESCTVEVPVLAPTTPGASHRVACPVEREEDGP